MKRTLSVLMIVGMIWCMSCGGGSSSGSTGNPSKLYVASLMDGTDEIGTVFADDAGNSIVSIRETPGQDDIKMIVADFADGSFMTVNMQNGVPVSATDGTTTATFSNWSGSAVDVTFSSEGETETVAEVEYDEYLASVIATKGFSQFAGATWTTITVAFCPISLALSGLSMGAGLPASVVGCSLAATNLYKLLTKQPTLVEEAINYVSAPSSCADVQDNGGTQSQQQACAAAAGSGAQANETWILATGEVQTDEGSDDGDGDDSDNRVMGSCRISDTCTDYALLQDQVDQAREACIMSGGTFSNYACSTTGALGSCTVNAGTSSEYIMVYYPPTYTLEVAQQHCNLLNGTWSS